MRGHDNWIDLYTEYTDKQESPKSFQFWSAVSVIAATLGRRVVLNRGYFETYPNQYIILTAETASCRKSSAAEIAVENILKVTALVDIQSERLTTEVICEHLGRTNTANNDILIFASELDTFLGAGPNQRDKINMLTSFYTCPTERDYKTRHAGKFKIRNVCINLLGCTVLGWLAENLPGSAIDWGFAGRVLFVVGEQPRCINSAIRGSLPPAKHEIKRALMIDLQRVAKLHGEFKLDKESQKLYDSWYCKLRISPIPDPRMTGYFGRKGDHVLKIAMALLASELHVQSDKDLIITVNHIQRAIWELDTIEELMPLAYQGTAYSKGAKHHDRILKQIKKKGGVCEHSALLRMNNYHVDNADEFGKIMRTLIESEMVEEYIDGKRRRRVYKLKGGGKGS